LLYSEQEMPRINGSKEECENASVQVKNMSASWTEVFYYPSSIL